MAAVLTPLNVCRLIHCVAGPDIQEICWLSCYCALKNVAVLVLFQLTRMAFVCVIFSPLLLCIKCFTLFQCSFVIFTSVMGIRQKISDSTLKLLLEFVCVVCGASFLPKSVPFFKNQQSVVTNNSGGLYCLCIIWGLVYCFPVFCCLLIWYCEAMFSSCPVEPSRHGTDQDD